MVVSKHPHALELIKDRVRLACAGRAVDVQGVDRAPSTFAPAVSSFLVEHQLPGSLSGMHVFARLRLSVRTGNVGLEGLKVARFVVERLEARGAC